MPRPSATRRSALHVASALGLVVACSAPPARAEVRLSADVATEVYTLDRRRDGSDEDTRSTFASVAPSFGATASSPRMFLGANAGAVYRRSLDSGDDQVEPRVALSARAAVIERVLLVEARASSAFRDTSSISTSRALSAGADNASDLATVPVPGGADEARGVDDDRFSRVDSFSIGPDFGRRVGDRTRVEAAYRFSVDHSENDALGSTRRHSLAAGSRSRLGRDGRTVFQIRADADAAEADGVEADAASAIVTLARAFHARFGLSASAGVDRVRARTRTANGVADEDPEDADIDESGAVYGAAAYWRPSRNVLGTLSWTQRSYGASPAASVAVQGRRSTIRFGWRRDLAFAGGVDAVAGFAGLEIPGPGRGDLVSGLPVPEVDGDATEPDGAAFGDADAGALDGTGRALFGRDLVAVAQEVVLSWSMRGRVTELSAALAHVRRERIDGEGDDASGTTVALRASRALGRRAVLALDGRYGVEEERGRGDAAANDDGTEAESRIARIGLTLTVELR